MTIQARRNSSKSTHHDRCSGGSVRSCVLASPTGFFLDSPTSKASDGVHVVFAGEMVRAHEPGPNPSLDETATWGGVPYLPLLALVQVKLTAFRRKDQVHLLDFIGVGLIDASWLDRLPAPLTTRLHRCLTIPKAEPSPAGKARIGIARRLLPLDGGIAGFVVVRGAVAQARNLRLHRFAVGTVEVR